MVRERLYQDLLAAGIRFEGLQTGSCQISFPISDLDSRGMLGYPSYINRWIARISRMAVSQARSSKILSIEPEGIVIQIERDAERVSYYLVVLLRVFHQA
jgi:hypothetical protein